MNPWKLILATVIIFGAGIVIGGVAGRYLAAMPAKNAQHSAQSGGSTNRPPTEKPIDFSKIRQPDLLSQQFVQQLDDGLKLNPAQHEAIQKIITCGQDWNHCVWTNCAAQSRQVLQTVHQKIREQLSDDQKKEFEKLLKQFHATSHKPAGSATNAPPAMPPTNVPSLLSTNLAGT